MTHLSLRQYRAPTGEMVPLLQISPSKTDIERIIPADPDLVAVLARVIRRLRHRVELLHGQPDGMAGATLSLAMTMLLRTPHGPGRLVTSSTSANNE